MEQGSVMDRRMGDGWKIPAASLSLFNTLSIIVLIPLYDRGLVPLLRRLGIKISLLSRIGTARLAHAWRLHIGALHAQCQPAGYRWRRSAEHHCLQLPMLMVVTFGRQQEGRHHEGVC